KSHELWLIEGKNDHAAHVLLELRARTSLFVPKINPFNAGADALKELIKQRLEDRALIPKVEIEGATRDGDPFGDVVDGGLEVALLSKDVEGGVEDLTPPHRPSIRCPHPSSLTHVPARRIGFIDRSGGELIFRDIAEVRPEPTLNLRDTHALSLRIFLNLIASNPADIEIARFGMREIDPAHARGRTHREALGEFHSDRFGVENVEELPFFGVVGARRIAERRTNPSVALFDEIVVRERLIG